MEIDRRRALKLLGLGTGGLFVASACNFLTQRGVLPTAVPTSTLGPTDTLVPSATSTPLPTETASASPTMTPSATNTETATSTETPIPTETPTDSLREFFKELGVEWQGDGTFKATVSGEVFRVTGWESRGLDKDCRPIFSLNFVGEGECTPTSTRQPATRVPSSTPTHIPEIPTATEVPSTNPPENTPISVNTPIPHNTPISEDTPVPDTAVPPPSTPIPQNTPTPADRPTSPYQTPIATP